MDDKKTFFASISSLVPSFLVATCCLGPLIFILTGVSVTWLSSFTSFSRYKPYLILFGFLILLYPFYQLYLKKPLIECDCETDPAKVRMKKVNKVLFWLSVGVLIIASVYPYVFNSIL